MSVCKKYVRKIALGAASVLGLISLCGCGANLPFTQKAPDFDKSYTVSAEITCDDLSAKADLTRTGENNWEFMFKEPKQLNGIKMLFDENGCSASLDGLSFSAEDNAGYTMLPEIISASVDSLTKCASENMTAADGVLTLDTEFDGKKVTVTVNERSGELISLKCPYHKLSVNFSGQKAYTAPAQSESSEAEDISVTEW